MSVSEFNKDELLIILIALGNAKSGDQELQDGINRLFTKVKGFLNDLFR